MKKSTLEYPFEVHPMSKEEGGGYSIHFLRDPDAQLAALSQDTRKTSARQLVSVTSLLP